MNTQGPYYINPNLPDLFGSPLQQVPVTVTVGQNGMLEIINPTGLFLSLLFPNKGTVTQAPRTQAIYELVADSMGQQTVTVATNINPPTQVSDQGVPIRQNPFPRKKGLDYFWVNVYEAGEIEWYPPIALEAPVGQSGWVSAIGNAGYTLVVPTTQTWYGEQADGMSFLTGFDVSLNAAATSSFGTLQIVNLQPDPTGNGTMTYIIRTAEEGTVPPGGQLYSVRFPAPIANNPKKGPIQFLVPNVGNASVAVTAFYYLD